MCEVRVMAGGEGEGERAKKEEGGDGNKAQGEWVEMQHRAGEQGGSRAAPGGEGRDFPAGTSQPGPWGPAQSLNKADRVCRDPAQCTGCAMCRLLGRWKAKEQKREGRRCASAGTGRVGSVAPPEDTSRGHG